MFISIPYDEGWEIKVDGKEEKDAGKVKGFFSFELEEGYHEIEMSFVPRGFTAGVVLSLVGVGLLVVFIVVIDSSVTCRRRSE